MEELGGLDSRSVGTLGLLADRIEEALCFPNWPGWEHCVGCVCCDIGNCTWVASGLYTDGWHQYTELPEVGL